jgi:hypothetical protein
MADSIDAGLATHQSLHDELSGEEIAWWHEQTWAHSPTNKAVSNGVVNGYMWLVDCTGGCNVQSFSVKSGPAAHRRAHPQ